MTKFEWMTRAQRHFAKLTQDFRYNWYMYAEACYDNMIDTEEYQNEPEDAVDEELSYWN
jgi:hypothetical protein